VGDIFVINKADREGADKTHNELRQMIDMGHKKYEEGKWKPPILKAEAVFDRGVRNSWKPSKNTGTTFSPQARARGPGKKRTGS
jgi:putative protein kinase ArgK-like GTPase of G3E family